MLTPRIERAMRWAFECHEGQRRRGSGLPYAQHVAAVALLLARSGFDEDVVIAGMLHDAVEDTPATLEEVRGRFGEAVAAIVAFCSEVKLDAEGRKRPWIDRKRDHLAALVAAPVEARAVVLADKLHNLLSIRVDLEEGRDLWPLFHAPPDRVRWYYESAVEALGTGDPRLETLAGECRIALAAIDFGAAPPEKSASSGRAG